MREAVVVISSETAKVISFAPEQVCVFAYVLVASVGLVPSDCLGQWL